MSALVPLILVFFALIIGVKIYNLFEGEALLSDYFLNLRTRKINLAELDAQAFENPGKSDVIVSLTSIPSRLGYIENTLKSLLNQSLLPKKICLNLPYYSIREERDYNIPSSLLDLKMVEIVRCEDVGPATKILPTLEREKPDQPIFVVDDDRIYHRNLIADLTSALEKWPEKALGFSGWVVPEDFLDRPTTIFTNLFMRPPAPVRCTRLSHPFSVDILQGVSGYCIKPRFFPDISTLLNYSNAPDAAFYVDDVWISAHCKSEKIVIPAKRSNFQPKSMARLYRQNSLANINRGNGTLENRNNTVMIKHLQEYWTVGGKALSVESSNNEE